MHDGAEEAKRSARILDVLARYDIPTEKAGRQYKACCPFHDDNSPSLSVDPVKNVWHCFGCDKGGSVIDFVMLKESIPFNEAVSRLLVDGHQVKRGSAINSTISIRGTGKAAGDPGALAAPVPATLQSKSHGVDLKLIESIIGQYEKTLAGPDTKGLDYLKRRSLADPETLKTFRVGYVNGTLKKLLPASAVEPLQRLGILNEKGNEFFYGCVVVPVFLADGSLGEMYGRSIEGNRHLYLPGAHRGVLNTKAAEVFDEIILTEAILDALSLYTIGVQNVIPCYGTGGYTADHAETLRKTRRVFLAFDNDEAGENASRKLADRLTADGKECHRVHIPELDGKAKDLNDYTRQLRGQGMTVEQVKAAFAELMKHAPRVGFHRSGGGNTGTLSLVEQTENALVFRNCEALYHLRGLYDNNSASLRVIMTARREDSSHTDRLDLYTAKHRVSFAYRAAHRLELPAAKIEEDLNRLIPMLEMLLTENRSKADDKSRRPEMTAEENREALALLRHPRLLDRIAADLETVGYVGEEGNKQLAYLIATSRKLDKPLSAIVRSESGAGKSYLMECVAELMPPEDVKYYSRLTPQSLYYMGRDELVHKLLIVDERDGSEEAEYPIRTLQTRRKLTLAVPIKDPSTGKSTTKMLEILGPMSYLESTTATTINPENSNRSFEIYLDESDEQTRRIYVAQRKAHTLAGWQAEDKRAEAIRRHQNAQRLLRPLRVLIPFTEAIRFPESWTRGRRDNERMLYLVQAITFLHQHQRPVKTDPAKGDYIEATIADYAAAYGLARAALAQALCDLPRLARTVLSHLHVMVREWSQRLGIAEKDYGFRQRDIREFTKLPHHAVKRAMKSLEELEFVHVRGGGRGRAPVYILAATEKLADPLTGLTTPEELKRQWKP